MIVFTASKKPGPKRTPQPCDMCRNTGTVQGRDERGRVIETQCNQCQGEGEIR